MTQIVFAEEQKVGSHPELGEVLYPLVSFDPKNAASVQNASAALQRRYGWKTAPVLSGGAEKSTFSGLWNIVRRRLLSP